MNPINRMNASGFGYRIRGVTRAAAAMLALILAGHAAQAQAPTHARAAAAHASTADIRDIRGPKPLHGDWTLPLIVVAGLLTGAAAYGSWFWSRRRTRLPRSPAEIALERLVAAQGLIDVQNGREFSIEVSGIVREYIEQQFQVQAAHRTTDEFLHDLVDSSHRALTAHRGTLEGFLATCDLAKFGGWNLSAADRETVRAGAVRFVTESAPTTADSSTDAPTQTPTESSSRPARPLASALSPSPARTSHAAFPTT
jgi:hypothetical protein